MLRPMTPADRLDRELRERSGSSSIPTLPDVKSLHIVTYGRKMYNYLDFVDKTT